MKDPPPPATFTKNLRLRRRADYRRVYDEGQRRSSPLCTAFLLSNGLPHTRLGVTTPAALGNAVLRNRLKRRLREVFRRNYGAIAGGWDVVLNPRPAAARVPFQHLVKEILRLLPRTPPAERAPRAGDAVPGQAP
jgi:ribonuclease P protein component